MKKLTGIILLLALTLGLFTAFPSPANALDNGFIYLRPNKAVSSILSGTKKYSLRYNVVKYKLTLYIDGRPKLDIDECKYAYVWLLNMNSTTKLISIIYPNLQHKFFDKIYRYDNGELVLLCDIGYIITSNTGFFQIQSESAGRNEFLFSCWRQESSLGLYWIDAKFKYNTSNNKISKATNKYDVILESNGNTPGMPGGWQDNWGTVCKEFKTYTTAGGNTLSFSAKKGDRLRVQQVVIWTKAVYFQVKNNQGKTGWYKDPKKKPNKNSYFFMEAEP